MLDQFFWEKFRIYSTNLKIDHNNRVASQEFEREFTPDRVINADKVGGSSDGSPERIMINIGMQVEIHKANWRRFYVYVDRLYSRMIKESEDFMTKPLPH